MTFCSIDHKSQVITYIIVCTTATNLLRITLLQRRNRFAPVVAGAESWFIGRAIPEGNLIWQDVKYVIPMRLLSPFFSINREISLDLVVKFSLEQNTKKLFEATVADVGENVNRNLPKMKPILFETPKIHYNTYTFTARQAAIQAHIY